MGALRIFNAAKWLRSLEKGESPCGKRSKNHRSDGSHQNFEKPRRDSERKGLSNALRHEMEFYQDFGQLIRIDNRDG